jgi:hypothetical protein
MSSGCGSVLFSQFRRVNSSRPSTRLDRVLPKRWTTGWTTCSFGCFGFSTFGPAGYSAHFLSARPSGSQFQHTRCAWFCAAATMATAVVLARCWGPSGCARRHPRHRLPSAVPCAQRPGHTAYVLAIIAAPGTTHSG